MGKLKSIICNERHPVWVFIQQFAVRGLLGLKFLVIARLLDPKEVGIISLALISITFTESLTEIGLMQAIVQNKRKITHYNVLWTLQFIRGVIITLVLLLINGPLVSFFKEPDAKNILFLAAFLPLVKNSLSSKYYFELRDNKFRDVSMIFGFASLLDLIISVILVYIFRNPIYAIFSLIVSELIKSLFSHMRFGWTIKFDFKFHLIKEIMAYGRWIWGNSISSFLVNQFDKILATNFLGTKALGLYQLSQKLTQLVVADISYASGQYLFPRFSTLYRNKRKQRNLKKYYADMMLLMSLFSLILSIFVWIYSYQIINIVFGEKWLAMSGVIKLMIISSSLAAINNISVVFNRAVGNPKRVTITSYIQLVVFIILCIILIHPLNIQGLVIGNIISYIISLVLLNMSFKKKWIYLLKTILKNHKFVISILIAVLVLFLVQFSSSSYSFYISLLIFIISCFYIALEFKKMEE